MFIHFKTNTLRLGIVILALNANVILASDLKISVVDEKEQPLPWAVVYVKQNKPLSQKKQIVVDQVDKEFTPYVTAIQKGNAINFPNNDNIRHQVYSFSKAKQFEIPLYSGNPIRPVTFDTTGVIAMACNIHDWMSAYVYVVESDKFIVTNEQGEGVISGLNTGEYQVLAWHPKLKGESVDTTQSINIGALDTQIKFALEKKTLLKSWRAPKNNKRRGY